MLNLVAKKEKKNPKKTLRNIYIHTNEQNDNICD
jgi:hypothetical protein